MAYLLSSLVVLCSYFHSQIKLFNEIQVLTVKENVLKSQTIVSRVAAEFTRILGSWLFIIIIIFLINRVSFTTYQKFFYHCAFPLSLAELCYQCSVPLLCHNELRGNSALTQRGAQKGLRGKVSVTSFST